MYFPCIRIYIAVHSSFDGDVWAEFLFGLVDIIWHDDLSLFAEDGQDVIKEVVWWQTNGHGDFSCWLAVAGLAENFDGEMRFTK
jgi:hypothetical protein